MPGEWFAGIAGTNFPGMCDFWAFRFLGNLVEIPVNFYTYKYCTKKNKSATKDSKIKKV